MTSSDQTNVLLHSDIILEMPTEESHERQLHIIHFNDVYSVEAQKREPKGGAARFVQALRETRDKLNVGHPSRVVLTLFSGDALSPSILSNITNGEHVVRVLNEMQIDCAVIGNHDFDFGMENLLECLEKSNFPWLNTNCFDVMTGTVLADCRQWHMVQMGDVKVGLVGLVEPEWVVTLSTLDQNTLKVENFVEVGNLWAKRLKEEKGCDLVIALTHMRWPNDLLLADTAVEIDLILGGHDHDFNVVCSPVTGVYVVKSGTDFRDFSTLHITVNKKAKKITSFSWDRTTLTGDKPEDPQTKQLIATYTENLDKLLDRVVGEIAEPLDLRFESIRKQETNGGNFVCDVMLTAVEADVALLNSGTLRIDTIIPAGPLSLRDLNLTLPFITPIFRIDATGEQLLKLLENSVSQYPKMEGRFLQVGGVQFTFDPSQPSNHRIRPEDVFVGDQPLQLTTKYQIATTSYVAEGNDGFDAARECLRPMMDDDGPDLLTSVHNYFRTIAVLRGFNSSRMCHHLQHLCSRKKWNARHSGQHTHTSVEHWKQIRTAFLKEEKMASLTVAPKLEGRILMKSATLNSDNG